MEKIQEHNNVWCDGYHAAVLPDEQGNCSLCQAKLHELTQPEAEDLLHKMEDIAIERTINEDWNASDWLEEDEVKALYAAKEKAYE